jgi:hypothetical protein
MGSKFLKFFLFKKKNQIQILKNFDFEFFFLNF